MADENGIREKHLQSMLLKELRTECRHRGINPGGGRETLVDRLREDMISKNETTTANCQQKAFVPNEKASNNYSRPEGQNVGNFITGRSTSRVSAPPGGRQSFSFTGNASGGEVAETGKKKRESLANAPNATISTHTDKMMHNNLETKKVNVNLNANKSANAIDNKNVVVEEERIDVASNSTEPVRNINKNNAIQSSFSLSQCQGGTPIDNVGKSSRDNNYSRPGGMQNVGNYITGRNTSRVLAPPGGVSNISFN